MPEKMNGNIPHHRKSNIFRRRMSAAPLLGTRGEAMRSRLRSVHIAAATRAKMLAVCNDVPVMVVNRKQKFMPGVASYVRIHNALNYGTTLTDITKGHQFLLHIVPPSNCRNPSEEVCFRQPES